MAAMATELRKVGAMRGGRAPTTCEVTPPLHTV